jgi:hypothetical protein
MMCEFDFEFIRRGRWRWMDFVLGCSARRGGKATVHESTALSRWDTYRKLATVLIGISGSGNLECLTFQKAEEYLLASIDTELVFVWPLNEVILLAFVIRV